MLCILFDNMKNNCIIKEEAAVLPLCQDYGAKNFRCNFLTFQTSIIQRQEEERKNDGSKGAFCGLYGQ